MKFSCVIKDKKSIDYDDYILCKCIWGENSYKKKDMGHLRNIDVEACKIV